MNERIKQLFGQTLDNKFSHTWTVMDYQDLERFSDYFAELIVKECVNAVYDGTSDSEEYENRIKKHFGVE